MHTSMLNPMNPFTLRPPSIVDSAAFKQRVCVFPFPYAYGKSAIGCLYGKAFMWWTHARATSCSHLACSAGSDAVPARQVSRHMQGLWSGRGEPILDIHVLNAGCCAVAGLQTVREGEQART